MPINIELLDVRNKESAIEAIKTLLVDYNIKQEELYPWIACSDRLPENYSIVLCVIRLRDHPDSDYKITRRMKFIYGNNENKNWYEVSGESSELSKMDIWEFNKLYEVTHWHPIPTL